MRQPAEPINCARAQELIEDFVDDELDGARKWAFNAHLGSCTACAEETALSANVKSGLRQMPRYDTPEHVLRKVRRTIPPITAHPSRQRRLRRAAVGIAAVLLLATVAIPLLTPSRHHAPSDAELDRAVHEAKFAFALVGKTSRTAGDKLRSEALTPHLVAPAVNHLVGPLRKGLAHIPRNAPVQPSPTVTSQRSST